MFQELREKVQQLRVSYEDILEKQNTRLCHDRQIALGTFQPTRCPGFVWRHGWSPCQFDSQLTLRTIRFYNTHSNVYMPPICYRCQTAASQIQRWMLRGKYNAAGQRLCTRQGCHEPVVDGLDCDRHAQLRLEKRLERSMNRLKPGHSGMKKLWKVLSAGNMTTFLEESVFCVNPGWHKQRQWVTIASSMTCTDYTGPGVFFLDTETIKVPGEPMTILSIAIINAQGQLMLHEKVDYQKSIEELTAGLPGRLVAYAMRIYGVTTAASRTSGITPEELRRRMKIDLGITPNCMLVEWSLNGWDWRALKALFYGEDGVIPETYTRGQDLLKAVGYHGPKDLMTLFYLFWPSSGIVGKHHTADIDTIKLYAVIFPILSGKRGLPDCIRIHLKLGENTSYQSPSLPDDGNKSEEDDAYAYEDQDGDEEDDDNEDDYYEDDEYELFSEYVHTSDEDDEDDHEAPSRSKRRRK